MTDHTPDPVARVNALLRQAVDTLTDAVVAARDMIPMSPLGDPAKTCACGGRGIVLDSRVRPDGSWRRRYRCSKCEERWTTCEVRVQL